MNININRPVDTWCADIHEELVQRLAQHGDSKGCAVAAMSPLERHAVPVWAYFKDANTPYCAPLPLFPPPAGVILILILLLILLLLLIVIFIYLILVLSIYI